VTPRDAAEVTAPASRHNLHVTERSDLLGIGPWLQDQLWAAVERADREGELVVLDYGREQLSLVATEDVTYLPPSVLGFAESGGLRVREPRTYDPDRAAVSKPRVESRVIAPEFDILIPAFDWPEPDEQWEPPELEYRERPSDSPSGAVGGRGGLSRPPSRLFTYFCPSVESICKNPIFAVCTAIFPGFRPLSTEQCCG
jgi:hypothetical protein